MGAATDALGPPLFARHAQSAIDLAARADDVFAYLDDHVRLSAHMGRSSWRMGGGHMVVATDQGRGQRIGSRIRLEGRILGLLVSVDSTVVERDPPRRKRWETIGTPRLLVMGAYRMGFDITPLPSGCRLLVYIDYDLPTQGLSRSLGKLLGARYASWCTGMMVADTRRHFLR